MKIDLTDEERRILCSALDLKIEDEGDSISYEPLWDKLSKGLFVIEEVEEDE